jgi:hypothetical protein
MSITTPALTPRRAAIAIVAALAACGAIAPLAGAQSSAPPAKVTGAYLYLSKMQYSNGHHASVQPFATLVFRTDRQLPRRYDGLIRAGAGVTGQHSSIGSVNGKASRCYEISARIRPDNTITGTTAGGKLQHTKARVGSRLPVEITTADGAPTVKRTLTLRSARPGDASGKPLGC